MPETQGANLILLKQTKTTLEQKLKQKSWTIWVPAVFKASIEALHFGYS